jgi:hypothetical protein
MIKLTEEREITPYTWVSPDDDDGVASNSIHGRQALSSSELKIDETHRDLSQETRETVRR